MCQAFDCTQLIQLCYLSCEQYIEHLTRDKIWIADAFVRHRAWANWIINTRISGRRDSVRGSQWNHSSPTSYRTFEICCNRNNETEERNQNKPNETNAGEKDFSTNSRFGNRIDETDTSQRSCQEKEREQEEVEKRRERKNKLIQNVLCTFVIVQKSSKRFVPYEGQTMALSLYLSQTLYTWSLIARLYHP